MRKKVVAVMVGAVCIMTSLLGTAYAAYGEKSGTFKSYSYSVHAKATTSFAEAWMSYNSTGKLKIEQMISTGVFTDTYNTAEKASGSSLYASKEAGSGVTFYEMGCNYYIDGTKVNYVGVSAY